MKAFGALFAIQTFGRLVKQKYALPFLISIMKRELLFETKIFLEKGGKRELLIWFAHRFVSISQALFSWRQEKGTKMSIDWSARNGFQRSADEISGFLRLIRKIGIERLLCAFE